MAWYENIKNPMGLKQKGEAKYVLGDQREISRLSNGRVSFVSFGMIVVSHTSLDALRQDEVEA